MASLKNKFHTCPTLPHLCNQHVLVVTGNCHLQQPNFNGTGLCICFLKKIQLSDVTGARYGCILQGPKPGNLLHFARAEPKMLKIEIYLLNQKIAVLPPEKNICSYGDI